MFTIRSLQLSLLFFGVCFFANAQKLAVTNLSVDPSGNVTFNIFIDQNHSDREQYDLLVFSSVDNFEKPLGYLQQNLETGTLHRLGFDANKQVGSYEGPLQFRFDIKASVFPIKTNLSANDGLKKGKVPKLVWEDYNKVGPYKVELYKNGNLIQVIEESTLDNQVTNALPGDLEKGGGYEIKIASLSNSRMDSDRMPVVIKSKIGLGIKLLPVAVLGAGAAVLILGGDSSTPTGETEGFVDPPGDPDNQ